MSLWAEEARPFLLQVTDPVTALDLWISGACLMSHTLVPWPWVSRILQLIDSCPSPSSLPAPLPHCSEAGQDPETASQSHSSQGRKWQVCCCFCTLFTSHLHALGCFSPLFVCLYSFSTYLSHHNHVLAVAASHVSVRSCCLQEKETYTIFPEAFPSPVQQRVWFAM